MQQVPARAKVKGQAIDAEVLAMPPSLPGVPAMGGRGYVVLLMPDGEVKYYLRAAVETTEWKPV